MERGPAEGSPRRGVKFRYHTRMSDNPSDQPLRVRLRASLTRSIKRRNAVAVTALRSALAAIDNAEAVDAPPARTAGGSPIAGAVQGLGAGEAPRRHLSDADIAEIVRAEVAQRQAAAAEYDRLGRGETSTRLRAEAAALVEHLDPSAH